MENVLRFGTVAVHLGEKSGKYPDGNQVIVQGADTRVAFDTPLVANRIGPAFDEVELVILGHVHEDHMAGLHRVPNARVQVHEADLAAARSWEGLAAHFGYPADALAETKANVEKNFFYRPRPDATGYRDGEVWDLGGGVKVRAIHTPGHTAGHCVLMVDSEGVACLGDIDLTGFGPYYGDATSNLADFRRSLATVRELDAKVWVTYHHKGVLTDRSAFLAALDAFAGKIDERADKLLGWLREGPQTVAQLTGRGLMYPVGYEALFAAAVEGRSIRMHLEEFVAQGVAREVTTGVFEAV
ncbi:MAG: Hydroxyacylglutathione hydrolase [Pseudomonadota bacterium]|jgi:glyoxylase-like metal-dependent hydrolase (beta-lactamase superfamily II)